MELDDPSVTPEAEASSLFHSGRKWEGRADVADTFFETNGWTWRAPIRRHFHLSKKFLKYHSVIAAGDDSADSSFAADGGGGSEMRHFERFSR